MKISRAGNSSVVVLTLSAAVVVVATISRPPAQSPPSHNPGAPADSYVYTPAPAVRSYPALNSVIQVWIKTNNDGAIRAHGWDIWQSITTKTPYNGMPVWQTWFSGHELFEDTTQATTLFARSKRGVVQFGLRRAATRPPVSPAKRMDGLPYDHDERVFAFN